MAEDKEKNNQLVKAKTSSLQKRHSNIVSRGLADLALLTIESTVLSWQNKNPTSQLSDLSLSEIESVALNWFIQKHNDRGVDYVHKGQHDKAIEDFNDRQELPVLLAQG